MPVRSKQFPRSLALAVGLALAPPSGGPAGAVDLTVPLPAQQQLTFAWIPAGTFGMGGPRPLPHLARGPRVQVRLTRGFYLATTELTQGQWTAVMGSRPWADRAGVVDDPAAPAVYLSWRDVTTFVARAAAAVGRPRRLPTEAEWEYACRAGATADPGAGAWFYDNAYAAGQRHAAAVATKAANPWGLYDMGGNVWEWVADWYDPGYGQVAANAVANAVAVDPGGPRRGSHRVKRGGSFLDFAASVHCGARDGHSEGGSTYNIGARLALDGP